MEVLHRYRLNSADQHGATVDAAAAAASGGGGGGALEVGLVLLHLHHEVMQVDELRADRQAAEGGLVQDLVETVVVLDQLG